MTRRLLQSAGLDQLRDLARSASVTQLRRVLSSYSFDTPPSPEGERPEEHHRVSFGYTEEGSWSLSALLRSDEGRCGSGRSLWPENELFRAAQGDQASRSVSWADALVSVADPSLGAAASSRPHRGRAFRTDSERTRTLVEDRDRAVGFRVRAQPLTLRPPRRGLPEPGAS